MSPPPPSSTLFPYTTLFRSASGKYFYDPTGSPKEPLFAAIMLQLGQSPITKEAGLRELQQRGWVLVDATDRKSTRLNSSHGSISYAVFCLKKKKKKNIILQ